MLDSLQSQSQRHYQKLAVPNGTEAPLSTRAQSRESSYLQLHTPRPRAVSCLTEYRCAYVPHRPSLPVCRKHRIVGAKEESGFTEGNSLQPYTFLPLHMHVDGVCQTHSSVTRMDFLPSAFLQGSEMLPKLVSHAPRETGFTRDTRNPLASHASLLVHHCGGRQKSSVSAQRSIGLKEGSGFVLNTPTLRTLSHTPSDPMHFLTHYQSKFCDPAAIATLKANWTTGGIHTHGCSGYRGRDTDRFNLCGY
ncbi:protein phosphatase 1 regulatory subunit 32 [Pygocentrus nattereri]|uniref:Uncharacterized protein n=1 Tax=Pygocentrus nattereri TaxID=42514 RepID=A0A3B4DHP3_PYGNA|nr:protein phosphatase 1 regulatory subunit 32 [Pygocentrus nattereri]